MSGTFLAIVFIALVLLAFWRVVLLLVIAVLIAVFVLGVGLVTDDGVGLSQGPSPTAPVGDGTDSGPVPPR